MKKIYILAISCLGILSAQAQVIYSENFGQPTGSQAIAGYDGFQYESPIVYGGTATIDANNPANGYPASSGFGNIHFAPSSSQSFTISGINTAGFGTEDITLYFGYFKNPGTSSSTQDLKLETSINGIDFIESPYTRYTESGWERITVLNGIPSSSNLTIRFSQLSNIEYRLDDIILKTEYGCPLAFSTNYIICDNNTTASDTYTAYIPFYGGGTQSYGITTTSGTVSGDNPSTAESGLIQIVNITENMDANISITSENCSYSIYIVGPQCKPTQALPFYESFDYPAEASLTAYPIWAESTNGQNLVVNEGSLNYSGISSGYNSLQLANGKDAFVPFGSVTSGKIYTSFMLEIEDISNMQANLATTLIAGLSKSGSYNDLNMRFYIQKNGNQFKLGIASNSSDMTYTSGNYDLNETLFVILGYDYATNELMAWVNPDLSSVNANTQPALSITPAAAPASFGSLALYQNGVEAVVDEVKVATTLEAVTTSVLATQQNKISGFSMYPNPLNGSQLTIVTKNNLQKDVVIYDMMGKQVVNATTQNNSINASLTPGIYLVKVTEDGSTTTKKLVVN